MDINSMMSEEKVSKLLLKFSIPGIIATIINGIYTIISSIFIGNHPQLGVHGIAALAIYFPIQMIVVSFGMMIGGGGATLFSIRLGEKKPEESAKILGTSVFWMVIVSIVYSILGFAFMHPILSFFGASSEVMPYAEQYMKYILFASVFQLLGYGGNAFIRADGSPKVAMMSMISGAVLNIALNYVFIYIFNIGMAGAALATIGSTAVSSFWMLAYFFGKKSNIKLSLKNIKPRITLILKIAYTGISLFLMQIANCLLSVLINNSLGKYGGETAISAMGIINSIQNVMLMPLQGLIQGAMPIIGFNYGARKLSRVMETLKLTVIVASVIVVLGFAATRIFPTQIIRMFNKDPELIKVSLSTMKIWFICFPIVGFQVVCSNYFQAVGKAKYSAFFTLSRQIIILMPLVLVLPKAFGLNGIIISAPISDLLSAIIVSIFIIAEVRRLKLEELAVFHMKNPNGAL